MKAYKESRGIPPLILNLSTEWRRIVQINHGPRDSNFGPSGTLKGAIPTKLPYNNYKQKLNVLVVVSEATTFNIRASGRVTRKLQRSTDCSCVKFVWHSPFFSLLNPILRRHKEFFRAVGYSW